MYNSTFSQKQQFDKNVKKIQEELRELDIKNVIKFYFSRDYEDSEIEAALKNVDFVVKIICRYPTSIPSTPPTQSTTTPVSRSQPNPVPASKINIEPLSPSEHREKIQDWIKRIFRYLLSNHILTRQEIVCLHDKWYSKKTFGIAYPMFVDTLKETEVVGHNRYWKTCIGGYYICSQWWLDYEKEYYSNIKQWLAKVLPDYIERGLDRR